MFTATIALSPDDFALPHALETVPEMTVTAERLAAHSRHWVMPCLWAGGGDFDAFDAALDTDPTVDTVVSDTQVDNEKFYLIEWTDGVKQHIDVALDRQGSLLHAGTVGDEWHLRIRFDTPEQFAVFRTYLSDNDISFRLATLSQTTAPRQQPVGLTAAQRDALVVAVEEGYFAIPRETTMQGVADRLGISSQAASERLRRGVVQFVESALVASDTPVYE